MDKFRWTDLSAIAAVLVAMLGYARISYEQGRLEGEFNQRIKTVEDAAIDAKASIRIVPSLEGNVSGLRSEIQSLRTDIKDQGKKIDGLFERVVDGQMRRPKP